MKRGGPIERRTPLRKINPERVKRLREEAYGKYADEWIRGWPCDVPGCPRLSVAAHAAKTRGAGGKARDLNRLCIRHEDRFHRCGIASFERQYFGRTGALRELADQRWAEWNACR